MKRLIAVLFSIVLLIGCAMTTPVPPYTGPEHDVAMDTAFGPIDKVIAKASPTIVLRRYAIRSGSDTKIGLYKIEVGNPQRIKDVIYQIAITGFNGVTYQRKLGPEGKFSIKDEWVSARITTDMDEFGISTGVEGRKVSKIEDITLKDLPRKLGKVKSISVIERINVYDLYPESLSIFTNEGATIPDVYELMYEIKEILNES